LAEPKPFPQADLLTKTVQVWPVGTPTRYPSAEEIAQELFEAMQRQPLFAGKWVLAKSIELVIYPTVCEELGWPLRPWKGKKGVATFLARLLPEPPKYIRAEICGVSRPMPHYFIPHPQLIRPAAAGHSLVKYITAIE
jgi:hypothetical protein